MDDMLHKGYIMVNGISGARKVYRITIAGREFVKQGGYRGKLLDDQSLEVERLNPEKDKPVEKKRIFISYSHANIRKVELIKTALLKHPLFVPFIVADKRSPNDALVKLVKEGIDGSYCVIPILSPQSYKEQWINQEIGYAIGVGKKVAPIIGDTILDKLKGFVHKQNQCPYIYKSHKGTSITSENREFMKRFRQLISDLAEVVDIENKASEEKSKKSNINYDGPRFIRIN